MIVAKFGGTSVADAAAIGRLADIVTHDPHVGVIVVSALSGVTDRLVACLGLAACGQLDAALRHTAELRDRHRRLAAELGLPAPLAATVDGEFDAVDAVLRAAAAGGGPTPAQSDRVLAAGELASSHLVAAALRAAGLASERVDAREVMVTDDRFGAAQPLVPDTDARLAATVAPLVSAGWRVVLGGFIGATTTGETTTLGRGGSDYSASLFGAGLRADRVDIWTDVDGLLTADPRLVPHAHIVPHVSFAEASELAYFGAKVLHPSTLLPAMACGTPVRIRNARRPEGGGTLVTATAPASVTPLRGLAAKRGVTIVSIASTRMLDAHGFLARVFTVFDRYRTVVDAVTTSEVSVSVTIDDAAAIDAIEAELQPFADVRRTPDVALLCVVGERLRIDGGLCPAILESLGGLPLHMVSQAASRQNLTLVVDERDLPTAMSRLHARFFPVPEHEHTSAGDAAFAGARL